MAIVAGLLCLAAPSAFAYRPFDGTDTAVTDAGEFELELGPVGYLREGSVRSLFAPAVVANFGISHRRGSLQDASGPGIASECGVLLPTINGESGTGASCAGIVSQRWPMATVHLNAALFLDRKPDWNRFLGGIVEGPSEWPVRPVMEMFAERGMNGARTNSALVGLIWRAQKNLSFALGVRRARSDGENVSEIRTGLTWAFAIGK